MDFGIELGLWTLDSGVWSLDFGLWSLDPRLWTLDFGLWTLDFKFRVWSLDLGIGSGELYPGIPSGTGDLGTSSLGCGVERVGMSRE